MTFHAELARFRTQFESKGLTILLSVLLALIALIGMFELGKEVGFHEARGTGMWSENYERNFGEPSASLSGRGPQLPGGHGAMGTIASVSLPTFTLVDPNHPEEEIRITDNTIIKDMDATIPSSSLTSGMHVVVLGTPNNQGELTASLIRILPGKGTVMPAPGMPEQAR